MHCTTLVYHVAPRKDTTFISTCRPKVIATNEVDKTCMQLCGLLIDFNFLDSYIYTLN